MHAPALKPTPGTQVLGSARVPLYDAMDLASAQIIHGVLRKSSLSGHTTA
jgi:hypothetical protein